MAGLFSSGERTRTSDLRVMSPTSYQLLYPAMLGLQIYGFFANLQKYFQFLSSFAPKRERTRSGALVVIQSTSRAIISLIPASSLTVQTFTDMPIS